MQKTYLTKEQALQKLKHYCGYQERCHSEVISKLYDLGVYKNEHDEILSTLIQENYLNEERFAKAYAGGKWRAKRWGRVRIKMELQQRGVSVYCIRKAMAEIEEADYEKVLKELITKKYQSLKQFQYIIRQKKTADYIISRAFEPALVRAILSKL
mgnify:CR=1 FL=1